ncbi:MAG: aminotransferase class I/II-fold pyridoxal phosphate-dependent enzyme [Lachnospiraceae bacterium]|nr:aminotransferase class I/II-fold pyridoxal phosphate-dependent enzyme [Lachnospiraceae bacterium]MBQ7360592.1 aminotransferase class I/II-fold pyridoxal phosphate-dependent enzyme [Lachnospiraceae bacterium]
MKYDFTTIMNREGKDAIAVDIIPIEGAQIKEGFTKIPMWVADMNFATAPSIQKAVIERVEHPAFGYFEPSEEYFDAIANWQKVRNGVEGITQEHIGYENGVLGCVTSALNAFTSQGEPILVHRPCYIGFLHVLEDLGRKIVYSDLKRDEDGVWRMDYEDMDRKIKENNIHFVIFCTPHNPTGRVWEKEEIEKAMEVYKANDCIVVSDEIWSDLILPGAKHIPTQSISEDAKQRTIAIYAPSKTFNLAGLIGSYHIIYNKYLRDKVQREGAITHYNSMNVLSMHALVGAYGKEGQEWVDELRQVISDNVDYAHEFILKNFEGVSLAKPQGTYMLYLDCTQWCEIHKTTMDELLKAGAGVGVIWQDGRPFGFPNTIRINLAVPHSLVIEAMDRLKKYVF